MTIANKLEPIGIALIDAVLDADADIDAQRKLAQALAKHCLRRSYPEPDSQLPDTEPPDPEP